jgi:hypothetical protein
MACQIHGFYFFIFGDFQKFFHYFSSKTFPSLAFIDDGSLILAILPSNGTWWIMSDPGRTYDFSGIFQGKTTGIRVLDR